MNEKKLKKMIVVQEVHSPTQVQPDRCCAGRVMFKLDLFTQLIEKFIRWLRHQLEDGIDYNRGMEISKYSANSF